MKVTPVLGFVVVAALAIGTPAQDGNAILLRAAASDGLSSYMVPVHFDVHMLRPIGVKARVEGIVYYQAPAQAALTLTKIPSIIGQFFKGTYHLDMVPQTWPVKYVVQSFSQAQVNGMATYILHAVPKNDPAVADVDFGVTQADYAPVSVTWYYKDKSSIRITMVNQRVSSYVLPQTETIAVTMPHYALEAATRYGEYALNASIPATIFPKN